MFQIDPLSLIPDSLKTIVRDAAVDFVADQAKKLLGEELGGKIKKLRSDAGFAQKFDKGLQKALQRFVDEYAEQDEDLAAAISADVNVFKNEQVEKALLEMLKNPGRYLADEHEIVAENFVTVLPGRKNRERVDKAIAFLLRCLAEEMWNLPELQPIYNLQFQRMTAESMRQQVELQKAQLQALTTVNEGVRQALLQLTDAIAEKKMLPAPDALVAPVRPKVLHNLPQPDYGEFVGREKELAQIASLLSSKSRHFLVTIDGIGGIGKSAIALETAQRYLRDYEQLPAGERFEAIIWASAKLTVLTADGIKLRHQSLRNLKDIYAAIAITLQREDIIRANANEQAEIVRNALTKQRSLIIIDNLETVDDESILSFLQELPAPTKAIVTTRHRLDVAYPVRLTGMSWGDANSLILQECEKKNVVLEQSNVRKLFNRTGGVPLAIVWSLAQIGIGYGIETVLRRLGDARSDISHFCFDEIVKVIKDTTAFDVLLAISLFARDTERRAIVEATKLSEIDVDDGLAELEKLSLVNKFLGNQNENQLRFSLLPLTKSYVSYLFQLNPELYMKYWKNLAEYYVRWSQEKDSLVAGRSVESYSAWRYERENFLTIIDQAYAQEEYRLFLDLILTASYFQYTLGFWEERNHYAQKGIEIARNIRDNRSYARLVHDVAYMANSEDDWKTAEKLCNDAQAVFRTIDDPAHLASSLRLSGSIAYHLGKFKKAKKDLRESIAIMEKADNELGVAPACNVLATISIAEKNFMDARKLLARSLDVSNKAQHFDGIAHCLSTYGKLCLADGDLINAEKYFRESLEYEERMGRPPYQAMRMVKLAGVLLRKDEKSEAFVLAKKACEIAERVGMKKVIRDAQLILEQQL